MEVLELKNVLQDLITIFSLVTPSMPNTTQSSRQVYWDALEQFFTAQKNRADSASTSSSTQE